MAPETQQGRGARVRRAGDRVVATMASGVTRVVLLVGALVVYGLGAVASDDTTRVGEDVGPTLLVAACVAALFVVASWWPRRIPVLMLPAALVELAAIVAFALAA
jgi:hypothetical protein